jgi:hypothetical protein
MKAAADDHSPVMLSRIMTLSWTGLTVLAVLMLTVGSSRKRLPTLAFLVVSLGLVPACGGGKTPPPSTHDTITVNATSSGLNRKLTISLTLNH